MKLRYERTATGWNAIAGWRGKFYEWESAHKDIAGLRAVLGCYAAVMWSIPPRQQV